MENGEAAARREDESGDFRRRQSCDLIQDTESQRRFDSRDMEDDSEIPPHSGSDGEASDGDEILHQTGHRQGSSSAGHDRFHQGSCVFRSESSPPMSTSFRSDQSEPYGRSSIHMEQVGCPEASDSIFEARVLQTPAKRDTADGAAYIGRRSIEESEYNDPRYALPRTQSAPERYESRPERISAATEPGDGIWSGGASLQHIDSNLPTTSSYNTSSLFQVLSKATEPTIKYLSRDIRLSIAKEYGTLADQIIQNPENVLGWILLFVFP